MQADPSELSPLTSFQVPSEPSDSTSFKVGSQQLRLERNKALVSGRPHQSISGRKSRLCGLFQLRAQRRQAQQIELPQRFLLFIGQGQETFLDTAQDLYAVLPHCHQRLQLTHNAIQKPRHLAFYLIRGKVRLYQRHRLAIFLADANDDRLPGSWFVEPRVELSLRRIRTACKCESEVLFHPFRYVLVAKRIVARLHHQVVKSCAALPRR